MVVFNYATFQISLFDGRPAPPGEEAAGRSLSRKRLGSPSDTKIK